MIWVTGAVVFLLFTLVHVEYKDVDHSEEYLQLWSETMLHIMEESDADCLAHSPRTCVCGSPSVTASQVPLPFFHWLEHRVVVLADVMPDFGVAGNTITS